MLWAKNAPHIRLLEELSFNYWLNAKPQVNAYLFEKVEDEKAFCHLLKDEIQDEDGTNRIDNYVNNIPLKKVNPDLLVNFLEWLPVQRLRFSLSHNEDNWYWVTPRQCLSSQSIRTCPLSAWKWNLQLSDKIKVIT